MSVNVYGTITWKIFYLFLLHVDWLALLRAVVDGALR
jgi:hypothetical protein